jgi:hypothetical protein
MKTLIQHTETGLYLRGGGKWTKSPLEALAFLDDVRAHDYCVYRRLTKVCVVVLAELGAPIPAAMTGTAARSDRRIIEIENMKPKPSSTIKDTRKPTAASKSAEPSFKAVSKTQGTPPSMPGSAKLALTKQPSKALANPQPSLIQPLGGAGSSTSQTRPIKASPAAMVSAHETTTTVAARIDVGFGNALYIRGQGDGLSWEEGTPLECVAPDLWSWSTTRAKEKVIFKLLINDQVWSQGKDWTVGAGEKTEVAPVF